MARIPRRPVEGSPQNEAPAQEEPPSPPVIGVESDPLRVSLQRARRVAPELASATNAVNDALERVERALASLNLGVSASVDLHPGCSWEPGDWRPFLRFGKDGSAWRLLLEGYTVGASGDEGTESPLLSASKEIRLLAVARLPALVDALVQEAEQQVSSFRAAAERAQALAAAIAEAQ